MQSKSIKTIIVDDEKPSREALVNYITEYCPDIEIVSECKSAKAAYKSISELRPQLVFLDIEMPNGSGFDLLKMFENIDFKVIFITAFSDYAIQAFRFSATDYLLKPVKVVELIDAVAKVKQGLSVQDTNQHIQFLLQKLALPDETTKTLVIHHQKGFDVIRTSDIILCKADGYCTNFFLSENIKICSSKSLKYYQEILPDNQFMRVHNSYIINMSHVKGYAFNGEILLSENQSCFLSSGHKQSFLRNFKGNSKTKI